MVLGSDHTVVVPAHAIVERDLAAHVPCIQQVGPGAVLIGVACADPIGGAAAVDIASQKIIETVEDQLAAMS